jgi:hypothetical protein
MEKPATASVTSLTSFAILDKVIGGLSLESLQTPIERCVDPILATDQCLSKPCADAATMCIVEESEIRTCYQMGLSRRGRRTKLIDGCI